MPTQTPLYTSHEEAWEALGPDRTPWRLKGRPGQTVNLFEVLGSDETVVASIGPTGALTAPSIGASGALTGATGVISTADGLTVGGVIVPQAIEVAVSCVANAACVDQAFFIANRAYQVTAIREVHAVAGNDAGAVNLQVTKDVSTDAPGAGTDLLTNNTNAGFDCKGAANTVQVGTLTATAASLQLAVGDRLSLDFAGTVTTLAGLVVTVSLKPV